MLEAVDQEGVKAWAGEAMEVVVTLQAEEVQVTLQAEEVQVIEHLVDQCQQMRCSSVVEAAHYPERLCRGVEVVHCPVRLHREDLARDDLRRRQIFSALTMH